MKRKSKLRTLKMKKWEDPNCTLFNKSEISGRQKINWQHFLLLMFYIYNLCSLSVSLHLYVCFQSSAWLGFQSFLPDSQDLSHTVFNVSTKVFNIDARCTSNIFQNLKMSSRVQVKLNSRYKKCGYFIEAQTPTFCLTWTTAFQKSLASTRWQSSHIWYWMTNSTTNTCCRMAPFITWRGKGSNKLHHLLELCGKQRQKLCAYGDSLHGKKI